MTGKFTSCWEGEVKHLKIPRLEDEFLFRMACSGTFTGLVASGDSWNFHDNRESMVVL